MIPRDAPDHDLKKSIPSFLSLTRKSFGFQDVDLFRPLSVIIFDICIAELWHTSPHHLDMTLFLKCLSKHRKCIFAILLYLPNCKQLTFNFNCQYWWPAPSLWWRTSHWRPSTRSAMFQWRLCRWTPPRSRGTHKLCQVWVQTGQILSLRQTVLSVSLLGSETGGPPGVISCP